MDSKTMLVNLLNAIEHEDIVIANDMANQLLECINSGNSPAGHNAEGLRELCEGIIDDTSAYLAIEEVVIRSEESFKADLIEQIVNFRC